MHFRSGYSISFLLFCRGGGGAHTVTRAITTLQTMSGEHRCIYHVILHFNLPDVVLPVNERFLFSVYNSVREQARCTSRCSDTNHCNYDRIPVPTPRLATAVCLRQWMPQCRRTTSHYISFVVSFAISKSVHRRKSPFAVAGPRWWPS